MSLEDAVQRLANAVAMHDDTAVKEIIRQRDNALARLAGAESSGSRYEKWYEQEKTENVRLGRVISALRGAITRMKNKAAH